MLQSIFSGIQKFTTLDDPGYLGMTLFTGGCNYRCSYCHNPQFVIPEKITFVPQEEIIDFLKKRKGVLQSVTICGGEPTVHKNLMEWIYYIKSLGYRVKLDTNASNTKQLFKLIELRIVDYIALDYKAPVDNYEYIINKTLPPINFGMLVEKLKECHIPFEFRSTIHPDLHLKSDVLQMIQEVLNIGVDRYFLQYAINSSHTLQKLSSATYSVSERAIFLNKLKSAFKVFGLRNF